MCTKTVTACEKTFWHVSYSVVDTNVRLTYLNLLHVKFVITSVAPQALLNVTLQIQAEQTQFKGIGATTANI